MTGFMKVHIISYSSSTAGLGRFLCPASALSSLVTTVSAFMILPFLISKGYKANTMENGRRLIDLSPKAEQVKEKGGRKETKNKTAMWGGKHLR